MSIVALVGFFGIVYGAGAWWHGPAWWAGESFGQRYFLPMTPLWLLLAAVFFEKIPRLWRWTIIVICSIWTFLLFQAVGAYNYYISTRSIIERVGNVIAHFPQIFAEYFIPSKTSLENWQFFLLSVGLFILTFLIVSIVLLKVGKKVLLLSLIGIVLYFNVLMLEAAREGETVVTKLKKKGFYETVLHGTYDRWDYWTCLNEYAYYCWKTGKIREAVASLREALKVYPPLNPQTWQSLSAIYAKNPQEFEMEFVSKPDPSDYEQLGIILLKNGKKKLAEFHLETTIYPHNMTKNYN